MNEKTQITPTKIALLIVSSVISSAIVTAFALVRVANSDHFTIVALGSRLDSIEKVVVPRSEFESILNSIDNRLGRIENAVIKSN